MKAGTAKRGDRVIEDWDFGDREARTGTVRRVREPRYPGDRGARGLYIRWDEDAWPKCTQLPEAYLRRLPDQS
jgi:hypothetical protein